MYFTLKNNSASQYSEILATNDHFRLKPTKRASKKLQRKDGIKYITASFEFIKRKMLEMRINYEVDESWKKKTIYNQKHIIKGRASTKSYFQVIQECRIYQHIPMRYRIICLADNIA